MLRVHNQPYPGIRHGGVYLFNYYLPPAPSSFAWAPAWHPDGSRIAVAFQGSIWEVDLASGAASELTYRRSYHSSPAFSPDGRWLVYTADDNGAGISLEAFDTVTGEVRTLAGGSPFCLDPAFSPDGRRLAFTGTNSAGHLHVYVREFMDGAFTGSEIAVTCERRGPLDRPYFGAWDMHLQPAWTADGEELVLLSNREAPLGSGGLWRAPAVENGMSRARRILNEETLYRTRPHVSPEGLRLLYSSTSGSADAHHQLYFMPSQGGPGHKITFDSHDHFHPRWSPEGERIAFVSNADLLPVLVVMNLLGGSQRSYPLADLHWCRPMGKLRVSLIDDATGRPTPARIHLTASDGKVYAPPRCYSRISGRGAHCFHADGGFEIDLPPGITRVEAVRGVEYLPDQAEVDVPENGAIELTLRLRRGIRALARWRSGSAHCHMNYGGNLGNTPANMAFMAKAEDLDVLQALVANKDNRVIDREYFIAGEAEHAFSREAGPPRILFAQEYRPPFYGHAVLLGLREHLVWPFFTGYAGTALDSLYPSNTDVFRSALAQGAFISYSHAFNGERDPLEENLGGAPAFPVDAALGTVHGLEWSEASRVQLAIWHRILNCDLPIVPLGGEDAITDLHHMKLLGGMRTYAHTGEPITAANWIAALRKGATFISTGPLLEFTIEGEPVGAEIHVAAAAAVRFRGSVRSVAPLSSVTLYRNGEVYRSIELPEDGRTAEFDFTALVEQSGWYSLSVEGPPYAAWDARYVQAATNAIRVIVDGQRIWVADSAAYFVRWIDRLAGRAAAWPAWRTEREKNHVLEQFAEAREYYLGIRPAGRSGTGT